MIRRSLSRKWHLTTAWASPHGPQNQPTPPQAMKSSSRREQLTGLTEVLSKFPMKQSASMPKIPLADKISSGLLAQRYIQKDTVRERRFALCSRCGHLTVTIGFDGTPSARLGMMGRCGENDYSHHAFQHVREQDYVQLRPMKLNERLTWFAFHR